MNRRAEGVPTQDGPAAPNTGELLGGIPAADGDASRGAALPSVPAFRSPFLQEPNTRKSAVGIALRTLRDHAGRLLAEVGGTAKAGALRSCAAIFEELNEALDESETRRVIAEQGDAASISQMLLTLETALAGADWYYERTEDRRAFRAGRERMQLITALARRLEARGAARAVALLWRDSAPEGTHPPLSNAKPFTSARLPGRRV